MLEQPFSFVYRDQMRQAEKEAVAAAAKDPNRFQVQFKARDMPMNVKEVRSTRVRMCVCV